MRQVDFFVDGTPRPKQSFLYVKGGGYTKPGAKKWQTKVAWEAKIAMQGRDIFTGPVFVTMDFYLPDHIRRDCENLAKGVNDAMNNIVFNDDSQVVGLYIRKHFEKPAGVSINVKEMEA